MVVDIIFLIISLVLFIWLSSLLIAVIYGAPTVYVKNSSIEKAFELAKIRPGKTVLDLGCGNARSLIYAAKNFRAKGIGVEISPYYYLVAKLNVIFSGHSKQIKIYYGNILEKGDLIKEADIIYLYLFDKLLRKLLSVIEKNRKNGSQIVSVAFPVPNLKPASQSNSPKVFLYK